MVTKKSVTPENAEKTPAKSPAKKITRPPVTVKSDPVGVVVSEKKIEKFIGSAPDSPQKQKQTLQGRGLVRGKREQISHTIPPELLDKVDKLAQAKGLTRAGLINFAISEYVNK